MNSFGIFPISQQYTTFEYIKKKSMSKTYYLNVVLYQLKNNNNNNHPITNNSY